MDKNPLHTTASGANLGPAFLGVDWAVFSLSTIVVILRVSTRLWITCNFGWDDATILLTQLITAVGKGFVVTEVSYGLGQHRIALTVDQYSHFLKYNYLDTAQFFIALGVCKISICLFLLRLSQFDKLRNVLYGLVIFLILTHVPFFLLVVLQCNPVEKAWNVDVPGTCLSKQMVENVTIAQGVISALTDFLCAAFPTVLLRNLKIRKQSKFGLCALMGLGIITGGVAIARTATAGQIKSDDLSWVGIPNAMTRIFEVNIGNIAACIPILRPFIRYVRARITGKDPHEMLNRRHSAPSQFGNWYPNSMWFRRPSPTYVNPSSQTQQALPAGVVRARRGREVMPEDGEKSLGLPLQGIRRASVIDTSVPNLTLTDSASVARKPSDDSRDVKTMV